MSQTLQPALDSATLLHVLNARYAVKKFDSTRQIPGDVWNTLEEALILSPSSYGLQPWKFIVVTDPGVREELAPHAWNQPQITTCSHLVVFCARRELDGDDVEKLIAATAQKRGIAASDLHGYSSMIGSSISNLSPENLLSWNQKQVYVALEQFLLSCALLGVDACPMEGFSNAKFDEILGLYGVTSTVLATAGYRASDDKYADLAKVRYDKDELIEHR